MSLLSKITRRSTLGLLASLSLLGMNLSLAQAQDKNHVKIGVMAGDEGDVWKVAAKVAKERDGFEIELVYFSDYTIPNEALSAGDIDANAFQHQPYLDEQISQRGYDLTIAGYSALFPIGIYSHKIKSLDELADGASVGVPNDPSNEGRALRVLAQHGLITLDDPDNILVTLVNVKENPKKLDIREMDAGMVGRAIDDLDIAVVNTNWAVTVGLSGEKDGIAWERPENNPYNNIIVVRSQDKDAPWVAKLIAAYQSEEVRAELKRIFGVNVATSW